MRNNLLIENFSRRTGARTLRNQESCNGKILLPAGCSHSLRWFFDVQHSDILDHFSHRKIGAKANHRKLPIQILVKKSTKRLTPLNLKESPAPIFYRHQCLRWILRLPVKNQCLPLLRISRSISLLLYAPLLFCFSDADSQEDRTDIVNIAFESAWLFFRKLLFRLPIFIKKKSKEENTWSVETFLIKLL